MGWDGMGTGMRESCAGREIVSLGLSFFFLVSLDLFFSASTDLISILTRNLDIPSLAVSFLHICHSSFLFAGYQRCQAMFAKAGRRISSLSLDDNECKKIYQDLGSITLQYVSSKQDSRICRVFSFIERRLGMVGGGGGREGVERLRLSTTSPPTTHHPRSEQKPRSELYTRSDCAALGWYEVVAREPPFLGFPRESLDRE